MSLHREEFERAVLVGLSYFIGFITAFIAFGLQHPEPVELVITQPAITPVVEVATDMSEQLVVRVDGLYFIGDDTERLLAVNRASLQNAAVLEGFYYSIADTSVSPDGAFGYYCEQSMAEAAVCIPYVYEVQTDTIHPVQSPEPVTISTQAQWGTEGLLTVGSFTSTSPETPWR